MDTELGIRLGGEGRESEAKHKQHNVRVESSSSFVMREMSLHLCRSRVCVRSRPPSRDVRFSTLRTEFPECIAHTRRIGGVGWIPPSRFPESSFNALFQHFLWKLERANWSTSLFSSFLLLRSRHKRRLHEKKKIKRECWP